MRTDARGEFELVGLLQRDYRLEVMRRPSLLTAVSEAVVAVPDHAAHGVLMSGGGEVERIRLHPVPGELELLRP